MKICPRCKTQSTDDVIFCGSCGLKLSENSSNNVFAAKAENARSMSQQRPQQAVQQLQQTNAAVNRNVKPKKRSASPVVIPIVLVVLIGIGIGGYFLLKKYLVSPIERISSAWAKTINSESLHADTDASISVNSAFINLECSSDRLNTDEQNTIVTKADIKDLDLKEYGIQEEFYQVFASSSYTLVLDNDSESVHMCLFDTYDKKEIVPLYSDTRSGSATNADLPEIGFIALAGLNEMLGKDNEKFMDYVEDESEFQTALKGCLTIQNLMRYSKISTTGDVYSIDVDFYGCAKLLFGAVRPTIKKDCLDRIDELENRLESIKEDNQLTLTVVLDGEYISNAELICRAGTVDIELNMDLSGFDNTKVNVPSAVIASYDKEVNVDDSMNKFIFKRLLPVMLFGGSRD